MTRVTNFGRKRTHVEATFNYNDPGLQESDAEPPALEGAADEPSATVTTTADTRTADGQPVKKKRKRGPRKKAATEAAAGARDGGGGKDQEGEDVEREGKNSIGNPGRKGKNKRAKSRTIQGSCPLTTHSTSQKFISTPSRTQRSLRNATSEEKSRSKRQHHMFRLSREGACRPGLPQDCRRIHQTAGKAERFRRDRSRGDLLSLWFAEAPTVGLSREGVRPVQSSSVRLLFRLQRERPPRVAMSGEQGEGSVSRRRKLQVVWGNRPLGEELQTGG